MHDSSRLEGDAVRQLIRTALSNTHDAHLLHRLDGVLLVAEGHCCGAVAVWFGVDRRTVERWVHLASVAGVDGLAEHPHGGRPARLSSAQMQALRQDLRSAPAALGYPDRHWNGKRLALHLARRYGLALSVRSCQRVIARAASEGAAA